MMNKTSFNFALIAAMAITLFACSNARADVLASDNFNSYAAGALTGGAGGTGWGANAWLAPTGTGSSATVNGSGSVDVAVGTTTTLPASRLLAAGIQQTFYTSYTVRYNGTEGFNVSNTFGLVLSDLTVPSATVTNQFNFGVRTSATAPSSTDHFNIRVATAVGGSATGGLLVADTDYQLVAKLTWSGTNFDTANLWLNPIGPTETAPGATFSLTAGTGVTAINSIYFRQAANQIGDSYQVNNLVLATTWGEVVTAVPEPSTMGLLTLASVACLGLRRRGNRQA